MNSCLLQSNFEHSDFALERLHIHKNIFRLKSGHFVWNGVGVCVPPVSSPTPLIFPSCLGPWRLGSCRAASFIHCSILISRGVRENQQISFALKSSFTMIAKSIGVAAGAAAVGLISYCIYFDQKRRNHPDFRKNLLTSTWVLGLK